MMWSDKATSKKEQSSTLYLLLYQYLTIGKKKEKNNNLDCDVRLGIKEGVPQGSKTTWCARMVVTPKKKLNPRRIVDLQMVSC